jgi:hypothetical protein
MRNVISSCRTPPSPTPRALPLATSRQLTEIIVPTCIRVLSVGIELAAAAVVGFKFRAADAGVCAGVRLHERALVTIELPRLPADAACAQCAAFPALADLAFGMRAYSAIVLIAALPLPSSHTVAPCPALL